MTAGLYIHIPFCSIRCGYCDFYTVTNGEAAIPSYLEAVKREIELFADRADVKTLDFGTIYVGGGTPSLLRAAQIGGLIEHAASQLRFQEPVEITLEANPGTVSLDQFKAFRRVGVNRVSVGVQSFAESELKFLDRDHSAEQSVRCVDNARRAGFENVSLDLIFGLPGQETETWSQNLHRAAELAPDHISAYNLTFTDGTPLTRQLQQGRFELCDEEKQRAMQLAAIEILDRYGYPQYEISNYARPGFESRHNRKYWDGSPYLGLGASAHSFLQNTRFWNIKNYRLYTELLAQGKLAISGEEQLAQDDLCFERLFLGLRQRRGVNLSEFEAGTGIAFFDRYLRVMTKLFGCQFSDATIADLQLGKAHLSTQLMTFENGFLKLTEEGILVCDAICAEFV